MKNMELIILLLVPKKNQIAMKMNTKLLKEVKLNFYSVFYFGNLRKILKIKF